MQSQQAQTFSVTEQAREFAAEVAGSVERKKKNLASEPGLQVFLLYIRAHGRVPPHQVTGPITVQSVMGHAQFTAEGQTHDMPVGNVIALGAGLSHELSADEESVLLVTHAIGA